MDQKVLNDTIVAINSFLSNNILLIALLGCGIFYTIYSKGVQFRKLGAAFKQTFGESSQKIRNLKMKEYLHSKL